MWGGLMNGIGEWVAPSVRSPQETVRQRWQSIRRFVIDGATDVEDGEMETHVHTIMKVLLEEEDGIVAGEQMASGDSTTTDCLEYVLREQILETLCRLGVEDRPKGIRRVVVLAIATLLKGISRPLLPHVTMHNAINRLISSVNSPEDVQSFEFWAILGAICGKLSREPVLVSFLVSDTLEFALFQGLRRRLKYTKMAEDNSRRGMVQVLSAITTASTHDPRLNQSITSSGFGNDVAEGMACDFKDLLSSANQVLNSPNSEIDNVQGLSEYENFFNRFRFLVALSSVSGLSILQNFLHELSHTFLNSVFISSLLSPNTVPIHVATVSLRDMIRELQVVENGSPDLEKVRIRRLSDTLLALLLGPSPFLLSGLELPSYSQVQELLMRTLLQRINDPSFSLATCTLKLWLSLLLLHNQHVFHVLIWKYISSPSSSVHSFPLPTGDSYRKTTEELIEMYRSLSSICNPQQCDMSEEANAFDDYLEDSFSLLGEVSPAYNWQYKPETLTIEGKTEDEKVDSETEMEREIGPFLVTIFQKIEKLLELHLEEALMLTSILSILTHTPIPLLHCLLLPSSSSPSSSSSSSSSPSSSLPSLNHILWKLIKQVEQRAKETQDFSTLYELARLDMDRDESEPSELKVEHSWIKVVVVLREFILELAACVQAKQTLVPGN